MNQIQGWVDLFKLGIFFSTLIFGCQTTLGQVHLVARLPLWTDASFVAVFNGHRYYNIKPSGQVYCERGGTPIGDLLDGCIHCEKPKYQFFRRSFCQIPSCQIHFPDSPTLSKVSTVYIPKPVYWVFDFNKAQFSRKFGPYGLFTGFRTNHANGKVKVRGPRRRFFRPRWMTGFMYEASSLACLHELVGLRLNSYSDVALRETIKSRRFHALILDSCQANLPWVRLYYFDANPNPEYALRERISYYPSLYYAVDRYTYKRGSAFWFACELPDSAVHAAWHAQESKRPRTLRIRQVYQNSRTPPP